MKKIFYFILLLAISSCKDDKENVEPTTEPVSDLQKLTNHPEGVGTVVISEDGNTIYYTLQNPQAAPGNYNIDLYSIESDGTNQKKILTYPNVSALLPVISKNNKQLAFSVYRNSSTGMQGEIVVGNIDGTGLRIIQTDNTWMPVMAFVENDNSLLYSKQSTVWKVKTDNSSNKMIAGDGGTSAKAVSADQNLVLIENSSEAYSIDLDGQNKVNLGNNFRPWIISSFNPTFLLTKIMPVGSMQATVQIFISDATGTKKQLTNSEATNLPISFFPDGQEILFTSYKSASAQGDAELYSIKPDGSNLKRLTNNNYDEWAVGFLEQKRKVLFGSSKDGANNLYVLNLK
ncbi:TolB family protein [Adhaeribacter terreus]|uniref:TolB family protein n=1 Tax=Adhaeribacter terreus TaxID=529703 RepID=A0ABW0E526_9BACT